MQTVCWRCGKDVTHDYFSLSRETGCPACGTEVYGPLAWVSAGELLLFYSLSMGLMLLLIEPLGIAVALAAMAALWVLWFAVHPLARHWVYRHWLRRYRATGKVWGRHELPCWNCGEQVDIFGRAERDTSCRRCGARLFQGVRWRLVAGGLVRDFALLGLVFGPLLWLVTRHPETLLGMRYPIFLMVVHGLCLLVILLPSRLDRRMYLRWLKRYQAGEVQAPEPPKDWAVDWEAVRKTGDKEE